ncbi:MAG: adenylate cyclase, partial [Gammaproteobacteria bacterium]
MTDAKRRIAAILSADVVSYSRLMGSDERATLSALNSSRAVFREHISAHDGRVVDTSGDSVLAVFGSVVEAVLCALEVQQSIAILNAPLVSERWMQFRIGVNLGDVIEQEDGTVYGDGVNIAARLESLAQPGGITVSGQVHDFIEGKIQQTIEFIGEHEVKNIVRPIRVYQIGQPAEPENANQAVASTHSADQVPNRPSIAVLPFTNMSDDADEIYF